MLRKTSWIKICVEEKLFERKMNITLAQKYFERGNHSNILPQRELNIVPGKYPSGINPEFVSIKTY